MKRINEMIQNNLLGLLIVVVAFGIVLLSLLIVSSDKYEDEISNLRVENGKLNNENKELNHQITEQINAIDSLLENNKTECDCGWYEDFYYENAEGCGAYE